MGYAGSGRRWAAGARKEEAAVKKSGPREGLLIGPGRRACSAAAPQPKACRCQRGQGGWFGHGAGGSASLNDAGQERVRENGAVHGADHSVVIEVAPGQKGQVMARARPKKGENEGLPFDLELLKKDAGWGFALQPPAPAGRRGPTVEALVSDASAAFADPASMRTALKDPIRRAAQDSKGISTFAGLAGPSCPGGQADPPRRTT